MSRLNREIQTLARQAGGSHKTVHDRLKIAERLASHLLSLNIQIRTVQHLKAKHIECYIAERLEQGITLRTLHNEMAAVRVILRTAGWAKLANAERLSNKTLGLSGASRNGTRQAITPECYQAALAILQQKDAGLALTLQLARMMGLRSQEAVQCSQSLQTWAAVLERGDEQLTVVFGTKGGRPRQTRVLDREALTQAVHQAIAITAARNGRLIDKPDLKSAMNRWRSQTALAGLKGQYSLHSLRYAWAQDAMHYYRQQGFSNREASALVSMDLGHGDGRGRYVAQVYGKRL
ncbi:MULTISPECIES: integrase domain-containing protein [unclassified Brenneria]|uniref:integrase domain-containing protein n=1 Tax=unclassified Brenneria TaxID=2634434 RepID=UPI0029C27A3B|nr:MULTISPECIES: integrase domain-containing protein [unclassified Brenneria]MDX5630245.1 integrase domain-containing protein [Brenneria sp. L3-3Z]MDX5697390.1 integrase domain-containing protein [Brenneria sp. L4-2C]